MGFNLKNSIKASVQKTTTAIKKEVTKPTVLQGLQKATQITAGIVSLTPVGKALVVASTVIANKATNSNAASSYLGTDKNNSTLSMLPGGMLAQQILKVADPSLSDKLNSTLPDPKKMVVGDAKRLTTAAIKNPSSLSSVAHAVVSDNKKQITTNPMVSLVNKQLVKPTATLFNPAIRGIVAKPSLFMSVAKPIVNMQRSTISNVVIPKITQLGIRPSIGDVAIPNRSTLGVLNHIPPVVRPSFLPKPVNNSSMFVQQTTLPMADPTPEISAIQQVINDVTPPTPPEAQTTIQENTNAEVVDKPMALVPSTSTLPILTTPPPTAIVNPQASKGSLWDIIMHLFGIK
jgi:hypothetical protein